MRGTEILVEQHTPQAALVCDHAGVEIKSLVSRVHHVEHVVDAVGIIIGVDHPKPDRRQALRGNPQGSNVPAAPEQGTFQLGYVCFSGLRVES